MTELDITDAAWARYERTVSMLLSPLGPPDAEIDEKMDIAEYMLDVELPPLLRRFYCYTARRSDINETVNRLISPETKQGYLIFYEENQSVCYWGIALADLGREDPPIHRGIPCHGVAEWEWFQETETLSGFLEMMLIWQYSWGGAEYQAETTVSVDIADRMYGAADNWEKLADPGHSGIRAVWREGQLLTLTAVKDSVEVTGFGKTAGDLAAIASHFGFEWTRFECT